MRILGIDPGLATTGVGVVEKAGGIFRMVHCGVISTPAGIEDGERLLCLSDSLEELLREFSPDRAAVERLYFSRNVTTAIPVAQARGVVLLQLTRFGIPYGEYTPNQVKQGVTGSGRAAKAQVQEMVRRLLGLKKAPTPDDAADALAVAITHHHGSPLCRRG